MSWRISVAVPLVVSLSGIAGQADLARADDAYLCGPDNVVYVNAADLEAKKHSDPCIAAYYGITIETPANTALKSASSEAPRDVAQLAAHKITLKSSYLSEASSRVRLGHKMERHTLMAPPLASQGTDFRNVKIINASSADEQWFRHQR